MKSFKNRIKAHRTAVSAQKSGNPVCPNIVWTRFSIGCHKRKRSSLVPAKVGLLAYWSINTPRLLRMGKSALTSRPSCGFLPFFFGKNWCSDSNQPNYISTDYPNLQEKILSRKHGQVGKLSFPSKWRV